MQLPLGNTPSPPRSLLPSRLTRSPFRDVFRAEKTTVGRGGGTAQTGLSGHGCRLGLRRWGVGGWPDFCCAGRGQAALSRRSQAPSVTPVQSTRKVEDPRGASQTPVPSVDPPLILKYHWDPLVCNHMRRVTAHRVSAPRSQCPSHCGTVTMETQATPGEACLECR